jgi:hypothetical protein
MANDTTNDAVAALRHALANHAPKPSRDFRRRAWQAFEQALDRHLARQRATARVTQRLH